jgi:hypothetical protein
VPTTPGTPDPADCTDLVAADVEAGTTLSAGCYRITESLDVTGDLVIEAGTTLYVDPNQYVTISSSGSLAANGTESAPIVFRGDTDAVGTWAGLSFADSGSPSNVLSWVTIDGAGNEAWNGDGTSVGSLFIDDASRVSMDHLTLTNAPGVALTVWGDDTIIELDTFTTSAVGVAGRLPIEDMAGISGTLDLSADDPTLHLRGDVTTDMTLPAYAYTITDTVEVSGDLTIAAGATLSFEADRSLAVINGSLDAIGTATEPIVFQGTESVSGYWFGLHFENSNAPNQLHYVEIHHGGSDFWTGSDESKASLYLEGNEVRIDVQNSLITEGEGPAIGITGADPAGKITIGSSTLSNCDLPVATSADGTGALAEDLVFTGHTDNHIRVVNLGFGGEDLGETITWPARDIPYFVDSMIFVFGSLHIAPGATVIFDDDTGLSVGSWPTEGGTLTIGETDGAEVLLTGASQVSGYWRGLYYNETTNANHLRNVRIEYAGSDAWTGASSSQAAVFVYTQSLLEINDTVFANNEFADVYVSDSTVTGCSNVTGTIDGNDSSTYCTF